MRYNFSLKLILNLTCLVLLMSALSCGLGDSEVDDFLDEYEEVVEKWEAKLASGEFSSSDIEAFERDMERMETRYDEFLSSDEEPSSDQEKREEKLDNRMVLVLEGMWAELVLEEELLEEEL